MIAAIEQDTKVRHCCSGKSAAVPFVIESLDIRIYYAEVQAYDVLLQKKRTLERWILVERWESGCVLRLMLILKLGRR